jgi:2,4-dienoyl-CoA reductase-like NADH-dependent reductase (Old Yellow Enzyme family)
MPHLFSPLPIKDLVLKNRIVVSPMCQYSSVDGFSSDWHLVHLGSRAVGGAALVIFEATAVSPEGRISPDDLGIWKDEHISGLSRITSFIESQGSLPGIQLAHAGRKGSTFSPWKGAGAISIKEGGWQTLAPSAIPFAEDYDLPQALDGAGIAKVLSDFRQATIRAMEAGFKVVEIHAAHGYLLHEFLSPLSNTRTDSYGGSFDNRIRLLIEVLDSVQSVWPKENPIFIRLSATDWTEGGWTVEDSVALARILKSRGADLIDTSTGGNVPRAQIPVAPGYQVPFAEKIKRGTGILTGAVGMITTAVQADEIIRAERADLVLLARELLRDAYFPLRAAHTLKIDIAWPAQYERAKLR